MPTSEPWPATLHVADRRLGGGQLYGELLTYLQGEVSRALFAPTSSATVYAAAPALTESAGWMAHDSGRDVDARTHFDGSYRLSLAAGSAAIAASMCASMSHLAAELGMIDDALRMADVGLDRASQAVGIARVVSRLYAMRARVHAMRGDRLECRADLSAAEHSITGDNDHEHATWSAPFDEGPSPVRPQSRCTSWEI